MGVTNIEWTDASWNPLRAVLGRAKGHHCVKVSPGCANCYAEAMNRRLGTRQPYTKHSKALPYLDELKLTEPLRWRKPRRVFVCSMTDLFGEWVDDATIDKVFAVMALCPQHTFQVLTKRAERMAGYFQKPWGDVIADIRHEYGQQRASDQSWLGQFAGAYAVDDYFQGTRPDNLSGEYWTSSKHPPLMPQTWPLPNVWLGVSVEDQQRADERIPHLLRTFAAVRFLSCEPLLGPIQFWALYPDDVDARGGQLTGAPMPGMAWSRIHWVIVGGESGPAARPCDVAWIRSIVQQCKAAGVACFVKQDSGSRPGMQGRLDDELWSTKEYP